MNLFNRALARFTDLYLVSPVLCIVAHSWHVEHRMAEIWMVIDPLAGGVRNRSPLRSAPVEFDADGGKSDRGLSCALTCFPHSLFTRKVGKLL